MVLDVCESRAGGGRRLTPPSIQTHEEHEEEVNKSLPLYAFLDSALKESAAAAQPQKASESGGPESVSRRPPAESVPGRLRTIPYTEEGSESQRCPGTRLGTPTASPCVDCTENAMPTLYI